MFMDFSGDAALAKEIFGIGDPGLNLLYSGYLTVTLQPSAHNSERAPTRVHATRQPFVV